MKAINLFGASGMGKSSVAAGVVWLMKSHHLRAELVTEHAKDLVHEGATLAELCQREPEILEAQAWRQERLLGKYDWMVTDSPLPLCSFYAGEPADAPFSRKVAERFARFDNLNFFLTRDLSADNPFDRTGRVHDRAASQAAEAQMRTFLAREGIACLELTVSLATPWDILAHAMPDAAICACPFGAAR